MVIVFMDHEQTNRRQQITGHSTTIRQNTGFTGLGVSAWSTYLRQILEGIRSMTEEQVMQAFAQFSNKARDLVLKAWSELKATNALPLLTKDQTGGKHAHHFKIRMSAHLNTPLLVRNPRGHRPRGSARSVLRDHDGQGRIRPRLQAGPAGNRARRPPLRSVPPPR